jgi:PAS domain S-box-containing protein
VRRGGLVAYGVVLLALAAYLVSLLRRRPGEYVAFFDLDVDMFVEFAAGLLCLVGALRRRTGRRAGVLLASALLLWTVGDLLFSVASPEGAPVPSPADGFFLAFYPLAYTAILISVHSEARLMSTSSWGDGLLSALGCATVVTATGLDKVLQPGSGSAAARIVTVAYPLGDLSLLSLVVGVVGVVPLRQFRRHLPWLFVLGGAALFAVSDTIYLTQSARGSYLQGTLVDGGWPAAMVLMSASTWPRRPSRGLGRPAGRAQVLLPAGAALIGFAILLEAALRPMERVDVLLATATLVTAAARLLTLLRELDGLEAERRMRRQAEQATALLRAQEAENRTLATRLAGLVDAAPVGIVEVDAAGHVRRWNRAAERIYGWTEAEVRGHPNPNPQRPARPGETVRHRCKDGSAVEVELSEADLGGPDQPDGVLSVVSDVSERITLELQLRHAQKLETVGRLAEGVAHELNTPIQFVGDSVRFLATAMAGLQRLQEEAQALAEQSPLAEQSGPAGQQVAAQPGAERQLERLRQVMDEIDLEFLAEEGPDAAGNALEGVQRMAEIVRAMGVFGRPGETLRRAVDLNEAVSAVLVIAGPRIAQFADVTTELAEVPMVVCHPGDVNQVLFDVVANAVDAMAASSTHRGRGTLHLRTAVDGDQVVVEVTDTGGGIPESIGERIFDPFFTTKPVGQGIGQGLSVARSLIVSRHGGTITFTSRPGHGTTFRIGLPLDLDLSGEGLPG